MKIKKYIVKALSEVDEMVRRDLGPNAVILTVRKIKYKGISSLFFADQLEVVAAIEEGELSNSPVPLKKQKPAEQKIKKEWESPMQTLEDSTSQSEEKKFPGLEEPSQFEISKIPGTYLDPRFNRKQAVEIANETIEANENLPFLQTKMEISPIFEKEDLPIPDFTLEINNFKKVSQQLLKQFAFEPLIESRLETVSLSDKKLEAMIERDSRFYDSIISWLHSLGLENPEAEEIGLNLQSHFGNNVNIKDFQDEEFAEQAIKEISSKIPISGPLLLSNGSPTKMAIIGPKGVGKTTTLIKIAYQYVKEAHKNVIILAHHFNPLLQEYCERLGISVKCLEDKKDLKNEMAASTQDLIFVDIPGFSKNEREQMDEWLDILDTVQIHLVLNAGIKNKDANEWKMLLKAFDPSALILTKVDETSNLGSIPTLCHLLNLPISYLSFGAKVPVDLQIADPHAIAKTIVAQT